MFSACSEKKPTKESQLSNPISSNPTYGKWRDNADTSHYIILTEKEWRDYYNGELVSVSPITYVDGRNPHNGTVEKTIRLEESKNNFYHFEVVMCDSLRLQLLHMESGREMYLVRNK